MKRFLSKKFVVLWLFTDFIHWMYSSSRNSRSIKCIDDVRTKMWNSNKYYKHNSIGDFVWYSILFIWYSLLLFFHFAFWMREMIECLFRFRYSLRRFSLLNVGDRCIFLPLYDEDTCINIHGSLRLMVSHCIMWMYGVDIYLYYTA